MKTARDLILELYKEDHITKQEADTLLDAIDNKNNYYTQPTYQPYVPTGLTSLTNNLDGQ